MADKPVTREEKYLAFLTGDYTGVLQKPITRTEKYLYELCLKGIGGEISPEEIKNAVNEYLEKNPVKPGATTEQAQQIEQNKTNIASLKEDLSNKITKFYASNQGETHLADSDNGKIMDMMLYGKSEQKKYSGKNLLNATLQTTAKNGVTCTANGDGTYTLNGTATERTEFIIDVFNIDISKKYKLIAFTKERSYINCFAQLNQSPWTIYGTSTDSQVTITDSENIRLVIAAIKGATLSNEIIKPMIVDASLYPDAAYDDFEPYTGGIPSPNPDYPQEIKSVVNPTVKVCGKNLLNPTLATTTVNGVTCTANKDGTYTLNGTAKSQTTFNLFNVKENIYGGKLITGCPSDGGRNTFNIVIVYYNKDKKWASEDYEVGNGKIIKAKNEPSYLLSIGILVRAGYACNNIIFKPMIIEGTVSAFEPYRGQTVTLPYTLNAIPVESGGNVTIDDQQYVADYVNVERGKLVKMVDSSKLDNTQSIANKTEWLLAEPQETDLTTEEITAFKALATYYPTTNISVNSEQLDGYTVFNYPISMENGWNYVKQQIGDTRDYIYDMDARTQDTNLYAAEAYVNSEYAVALTELEV